MKTATQNVGWLPLLLLGFGSAFAVAQESNRKELRREDLAGAPGMEVILSITELKPGDEIPVHFHHGIETGYVLEGGTVENASGARQELATGSPIMNLRDVVHGGFKVTGNRSIKFVTVHVVDKGRPLYDAKK